MNTETREQLPRLLDVKAISAELNVKHATAETIMRALPVIKIGRRYFVTEEAVNGYLRNAASTSGGTS